MFFSEPVESLQCSLQFRPQARRLSLEPLTRPVLAVHRAASLASRVRRIIGTFTGRRRRSWHEPARTQRIRPSLELFLPLREALTASLLVRAPTLGLELGDFGDMAVLDQQVELDEIRMRSVHSLQGRVRLPAPTLCREEIGLGAYLTLARRLSPVIGLRDDRGRPGHGRKGFLRLGLAPGRRRYSLPRAHPRSRLG